MFLIQVIPLIHEQIFNNTTRFATNLKFNVCDLRHWGTNYSKIINRTLKMHFALGFWVGYKKQTCTFCLIPLGQVYHCRVIR